MIFTPPIATRRSPKSICSCRPGGVSNRSSPVLRPSEPADRRLHGALQRSPADCHALLGQQVLAHHIRIAAMRNEPLAQSTSRPRRRFGRSGDPPRSPSLCDGCSAGCRTIRCRPRRAFRDSFLVHRSPLGYPRRGNSS
ncbi:hypothetical protein GGD62_007663 [Bradyrhizobium sp. ERR14]|nr:hypothetical protein [Bradyrhizobium sp. ERR14]